MFIATFPTCSSTNACCDDEQAETPTNCVFVDMVRDTVEDLRGVTDLVEDRMMATKGKDSIYDAQGHLYIYEPDELSADDGINYVKPATIPADQPGRWRLWI